MPRSVKANITVEQLRALRAAVWWFYKITRYLLNRKGDGLPGEVSELIRKEAERLVHEHG